jgi:hypothetical protein
MYEYSVCIIVLIQKRSIRMEREFKQYLSREKENYLLSQTANNLNHGIENVVFSEKDMKFYKASYHATKNRCRNGFSFQLKRASEYQHGKVKVVYRQDRQYDLTVTGRIMQITGSYIKLFCDRLQKEIKLSLIRIYYVKFIDAPFKIVHNWSRPL